MLLNDLMYRLGRLIGRERAEHDLDDELRFHIQKQIEKHMASGMAPGEARRRAHSEFGGLTRIKEQTRQAWGIAFLESSARDLAYALRGLWKSPIFTLTVILTLAIGIGANTAIFTLMDAVMWRTFPVRDPESLLRWGVHANGSDLTSAVPYGMYEILSENSPEAELAGYAPAPLNVSIDGAQEPTVQGLLVTGNYFSLLGVQPVLGRAIGPEDDETPNGHPVAVLTYGYWNERFAADPGVIGDTLDISSVPFTIVGIAPPKFSGVDRTTAPALFVPIMMQPTVMPAYENLLERPINMMNWVRVIGRVGEGSTPERASAQMNTLTISAIQTQNPAAGPPPEGFRFLLRPIGELSALRRQFSTPLVVLFGMVGIVLLIACVNTANLQLARAATRRGEFAVRLALGASRRRLTQHLLAESGLLALFGGTAGLLMAPLVTRLLATFVSRGSTPLALDLSPNARILEFTAAVTILTGILFGLVPALRSSRSDATPALKSMNAAGGTRLSGWRPGRFLAGAQVALSLLLLVGAGLFVRSLHDLRVGEAAGSSSRVLTMRVEPEGSDQRNIPGTGERLDRLYRGLIDRVEQIPGVTRVSMANSSPLTPTAGAGFPVETASGETIPVPMLMAYPDYFPIAGMSLVAGRDFGERDLASGARPVCIVNETLVRRVYPDRNPIGQPCATIGPRGSGQNVEIVGVVGDSRYTNPRADTGPVIYMPFLGAPTGRGQMILFVETDRTRNVEPEIRRAVAAVDPTMPLLEIRTLAEEMDAALVQERLLALLSSVFGGIALLLVSVGLYGLLAFWVAQRTRELGIRLALGAGRGQVMWLVLRDALVVLIVGVALGLPAAYATSPVAGTQISGLLFGLEVSDPSTVAAAVLVLVVVVIAAGLLPARKAAWLDPMETLRNE